MILTCFVHELNWFYLKLKIIASDFTLKFIVQFFFTWMYPNINHFIFNSIKLESILRNQFIQNQFFSFRTKDTLLWCLGSILTGMFVYASAELLPRHHIKQAIQQPLINQLMNLWHGSLWHHNHHNTNLSVAPPPPVNWCCFCMNWINQLYGPLFL